MARLQVLEMFLILTFVSCGLVSSQDAASSSPEYACGDTEAGAYYRGYSSSRVSVRSSVDCRKHCQDTENCQYWSWFASDSTNWANNCYFGPSRSSIKTDASASKAISGKRRCESIFVKNFRFTPSCLGECTDVQTNKIYTNYNYQSLKINKVSNVESDNKCRSICGITPDCAGWMRSAWSCRLLKDRDQLLSATRTNTHFTIGKKDCGSCSKAVVNFNARDGIQQEVVAKVLQEDFEVTDTNYWLSPAYLTGTDSYLEIDLGCVKEISGVYLRNTHNGHRNDRGTKSFALQFRIKTSDPWELIETSISSLERVYSNRLRNTKWVPFSVKLPLRYLKFVVNEFYGNGGGLSYIGAHEAGSEEGSSYPGDKYFALKCVPVSFDQNF